MKQLMQTQLTNIYIYKSCGIVLKMKLYEFPLVYISTQNKTTIYIRTSWSKVVTQKTLWAFFRLDRYSNKTVTVAAN